VPTRDPRALSTRGFLWISADFRRWLAPARHLPGSASEVPGTGRGGRSGTDRGVRRFEADQIVRAAARYASYAPRTSRIESPPNLSRNARATSNATAFSMTTLAAATALTSLRS